jgi:hypothetical protein
MFDVVTKFMEVPESHIREELEIPVIKDGEETIGPEDRNNFSQFPGDTDPSASDDRTTKSLQSNSGGTSERSNPSEDGG